ncbi:hypothetical protein [Candidatus Enterovibrio escicola]|uniref:Mobile element protein n=1 Tax=Candidatus Enterovibrio escicola TaxID=1927127 RepID=A0A2A5T7P3_9GAMM|nr:hypothetical protein [Candidatus Enterovibrio escacola]PCS24152.1 hypothetical protein BTN49_0146 [Candidatus Enterovibrio escacola]
MSNGDNVKIKNRISIEKQPDIADEKIKFGHLKNDTVVGTGQKSFLLTVLDKDNKLCCIRKIPNKKVGTVVEGVVIASTENQYK